MADANETVSASGNSVRPLTQEELNALTAELQEVLAKHSAEMGVTSTINLMKVITTTNESEPATEEAPESSETESEADSETASGS